MFELVLVEPEIAPNTGNIIRLCANTGCRLHLIRPLGFHMDDRRLRRAGLDYREWAEVREHQNFAAFLAALRPPRVWALSTRGRRSAFEARFEAGDALVFGPETRGLPGTLLDTLPPEQVLRLPMLAHSRSLNLANAVGIMVYEAWRQNGFRGAAAPRV